MTYENDVADAVAENIARCMERGPGLYADNQVPIAAVDPWTDAYLAAGLGIMGVGTMWCGAHNDDYSVRRLVDAIERGCPIDQQRSDDGLLGRAVTGDGDVIRRLLDGLRPGWEVDNPQRVLLTLPSTMFWDLATPRDVAEGKMTTDPELQEHSAIVEWEGQRLSVSFDREGLNRLLWERSSSGE